MSADAPRASGEIAAVVLAAGESSRMGRDKALLLYRGRTFIETILAKLHEAGIARVAVVLGHHAGLIQQAANLSAEEVVVNREYRRGQTSSLQAGLLALGAQAAPWPPASTAPEAVMLCLVDHPAFDSATVRALITTFESTRARAVIPTCGGRRGLPVLIAKALFARLLALAPGEGANTVLRAGRAQWKLVEVDDPGILIDIDNPEAYHALGAP